MSPFSIFEHVIVCTGPRISRDLQLHRISKFVYSISHLIRCNYDTFTNRALENLTLVISGRVPNPKIVSGSFLKCEMTGKTDLIECIFRLDWRLESFDYQIIIISWYIVRHTTYGPNKRVFPELLEPQGTLFIVQPDVLDFEFISSR